MYKKIFLILFLCTVTFVNSQNYIVYNETVIVNLNTSNYLVGETIYYKLYSLNASNNSKSALSKIAYIELIDDERNIIVKQKINLKDGIAFGDLFLPVELKTGVYKIIGYTSYMRNQEINSYFITDVTIINPYQSIISNSMDDSKTNSSFVKLTSSSEFVKIEKPKNIYSKRESINLNLTNSIENLEKNISVSVRKIDAFSNSESVKHIDNINKEIIKKSLLEIKIPELRGEIISGKIIANNKSMIIANKAIALSFPGEKFDVKIVNTNNKGEFNFILNETPNSINAVFQIIEDDRLNYTIELTEAKLDYSKLDFSKKVTITPEIKKIIESRSISNQIENAYFSIKKDTVKEESIGKSFYHPNEKIIKFDDYTRFPTLKETIIEILPEVFFKEKNNHYVINVRNDEDDIESSGTTLTLIDGLVIQNAEELFDYDTRNIDRVEFVNHKYVFGPKVFNGIINFITKNYNYVLKDTSRYILKTEIQRPLNKKYYYNQDYSDSAKFERIPDYRYQLLWMPELELKEDKTISFYTSDISGQFEINIEGFTSDGKPISIKEYFEVK